MRKLIFLNTFILTICLYNVIGQNSLIIGSKIDEIELPDINGSKLKLSSLNGQYVLIYFWASWCNSCINEYESIKKVYDKFKSIKFKNGMGFNVYNISLDGIKSRNGQEKQQNAFKEWKSVVTSQNKKWIHVSDLKGWNSPIAKKYSIRQLPFNILVSPSGIIITKNINVSHLDKVLSLARTYDSKTIIGELNMK